MTLIWASVVALLNVMDLSVFKKFFTIWVGVVGTVSLLIATHFHYKQWGPEIKDELQRMNLTFISDRPLTLFESVQFADTQYFLEIVSFNYKRVVTVQDDKGTRQVCIRITKNYWSDNITKLVILGNV